MKKKKISSYLRNKQKDAQTDQKAQISSQGAKINLHFKTHKPNNTNSPEASCTLRRWNRFAVHSVTVGASRSPDCIKAGHFTAFRVNRRQLSRGRKRQWNSNKTHRSLRKSHRTADNVTSVSPPPCRRSVPSFKVFLFFLWRRRNSKKNSLPKAAWVSRQLVDSVGRMFCVYLQSF